MDIYKAICEILASYIKNFLGWHARQSTFSSIFLHIEIWGYVWTTISPIYNNPNPNPNLSATCKD